MASVGSFSGLASGIQWRDMIDQIMQIESQRKLSPVTSRSKAAQSRADAWKSFDKLVRDLSNATKGLKDGSSFGQFSVTAAKSATTQKELVTASAAATAAPGSYDVEVQALATNSKLRAASAFSSLGDARGLTGTFHVGGRAVTVEATDSLSAIRDRINAANSGTRPSGVTASIVTVSPTEHYLTLTADNSGTRGIELVDSGDGSSTNGVLAQLGVLTGAQSANLSGGRTETQRFTSQDSAIASLLGLSSPPANAAINVGGVRVEVNLLTDTLSDLLDKIQAAGATAEIETESVGGTATYRLATDAITVNADPGNDQVDSQRIIELLGFVKGTGANVLEAGGNALVEIDGLALERRTNSVADAIEGVTLSLKAAELGTTVKVDVRRDVGAIVDQVDAFATAFNKVVAFQTAQKNSKGPLATDGSLRAAISSFKSVLLSDVLGIDASASQYTRSSLVGVEFTDKGSLTIDTEKLTAALSTNLADVKALFGANGRTTNSGVAYVGSTSATRAGTYAVSITQLATIASATGSGWVGAYDGSGADQMTVVDAYSGTTSVVALTAGATVDTVLQLLNDEFDADGSTLTASKDGSGQLVISGSKYGSAASFTVSYQQGGLAWAGASPTGIAAGSVAGLDVMGTIGGAAATGTGQLLTADDGSDAEGLAITYTGLGLGASGDVVFVSGLGGSLSSVAEGYTRTGDGLIATYLASIETSVKALADREAGIQSRLERYEASLVQRFTAMESAMSKTQNTGAWLTNQIAAMQASRS